MAEMEFDEIYRALSKPETGKGSGFTRRRLLQAAMVGAGAVAARPYFNAAAWAGPADDVASGNGVLVVIHMGGGNDGLNTVAPLSDPAYGAARGTLALTPDTALDIGSGFALHPNLARLKARYAAGNVGVILGVGAPGADLSHFAMMDTWMGGRSTSGPSNSGWLGRYTDGLDNELAGVAVGSSLPLLLAGDKDQSISVPTSLSGAFGTNRTDPDEARMFDAVKSFGAGTTGLGELGDELAGVGNRAMNLSTTLAPVYSTSLGTGPLANQLVLCARIINAGLGVRVLNVVYAPFDTHADQIRDQGDGLAEVDRAIQAFYDALEPAWGDAVTLMTWSEFGRRVEFNGTGTDHGTANCVFVIGNKVRGGLYGQQPSLTNLDAHGNMIATVDYRSVYTSILESWLAADAGEILGGTYENLRLFDGEPAYVPPPPPPPPPPPAPAPVAAPASAPAPRSSAPAAGYRLVTAGGDVVNFSRSGQFGAPGGSSPVVAATTTPSRNGCWLVRANGKVHAFGDAPQMGDMAGRSLTRPIHGIAPSPSGRGYWLLGEDGGIFSFGDAPFHGSTGNIHLNAPVVGMTAVPNGQGYWFVASDGGIFAFGPDAAFYGSMGGTHLNQPIVGMAATPSGRGYWLVAADGGIFAFGDAGFYGSTGGIKLNKPIVSMTPTPSGRGYWFVASDGGVFNFGDAEFHGSLGGHPPATPVVGIVA